MLVGQWRLGGLLAASIHRLQIFFLFIDSLSDNEGLVDCNS